MYVLTEKEKEALNLIWDQINEDWWGPEYSVFTREHFHDPHLLDAVSHLVGLMQLLKQGGSVAGKERIGFNKEGFFYLDDRRRQEATIGVDEIINAFRDLFNSGTISVSLSKLSGVVGKDSSYVRRRIHLLITFGFPISGGVDPTKDPNGETYIINRNVYKYISFKAIYQERLNEHESFCRQMMGPSLIPPAAPLLNIRQLLPLSAGNTYDFIMVDTDFTGSTKLKETVSPTDSARLLADWQEHFTTIIKIYGCRLFKMEGDGALFLVDGDYAMERALIASLHLLFYPLARYIKPLTYGERGSIRVTIHKAYIVWQEPQGLIRSHDIDIMGKIGKEAHLSNVLLITDSYRSALPDYIAKHFTALGEYHKHTIYSSSLAIVAGAINE